MHSRPQLSAFRTRAASDRQRELATASLRVGLARRGDGRAVRRCSAGLEAAAFVSHAGEMGRRSSERAMVARGLESVSRGLSAGTEASRCSLHGWRNAASRATLAFVACASSQGLPQPGGPTSGAARSSCRPSPRSTSRTCSAARSEPALRRRWSHGGGLLRREGVVDRFARRDSRRWPGRRGAARGRRYVSAVCTRLAIEPFADVALALPLSSDLSSLCERVPGTSASLPRRRIELADAAHRSDATGTKFASLPMVDRVTSGSKQGPPLELLPRDAVVRRCDAVHV